MQGPGAPKLRPSRRQCRGDLPAFQTRFAGHRTISLGGFGANHHLRQSLVFLDVPVLQQPEAYIGGAASLFDEAGDIAVPATRDFIAKFMAAFAAWVETHAKT